MWKSENRGRFDAQPARDTYVCDRRSSCDEVYKKSGASSPFSFADENGSKGRRAPLSSFLSSSTLPNTAPSYIMDASLSRLTPSRVCELISIALILIGLSYGPMLIAIGTKRLKAATSGSASLGLDTTRFYNASYGQNPLQLQLVRSNSASTASIVSYLSLADSLSASERWDRLKASVAAWENDPNAADFEGFSVGCGSLPNGCSVAGCLTKDAVVVVRALLPSPTARLNASSLFSGATPAAQTSPAACPSQYRAATLQQKVESYSVPKSLLDYFSDRRGGGGVEDDDVVIGTSTHLAGLGVLISDPPLATREPPSTTSATASTGVYVRQWYNITTVPRVGFSFPNVAYFEEDIPYMRPVSVLMRCERPTNKERKGSSGNPFEYCSHVAMADRCAAMANWGHPNQTFAREAIASVTGSQTLSSLNEATYVPLYQLESSLQSSFSQSSFPSSLSSVGCGVGQVCGTCSWLEYLQQYCVVVKPKPMPTTSTVQYERDWSYGSCRYPFVKEQLPANIPNSMNGLVASSLATFVFDDKNQYQRSLSAAIAKLFGAMSAPMTVNTVDSVGPLNRNNRHPDYSTVHVQYPQILMRKAGDPVLEIERLTLGTSGRSSQSIIVSGTSASGASRPPIRSTSYGQTATAFATSTIAVGASAIAVSLLAVVIGCGCFAEYFRFGDVRDEHDLRSSANYSSGSDTEECDAGNKVKNKVSARTSSTTKRRTQRRDLNKSVSLSSNSGRRPHKKEEDASPYGIRSNSSQQQQQQREPHQRRIWHNLESIISRKSDRQKQSHNQQQMEEEEMGGASSVTRDLKLSSSSPSSPVQLHSPRSPRGQRARSPRNDSFHYGYTYSTDILAPRR